MAQGLSASALGGRVLRERQFRDVPWLASSLLICLCPVLGQGGATDLEALHVLSDMVQIWSEDFPCLAKVHVKHKINNS